MSVVQTVARLPPWARIAAITLVGGLFRIAFLGQQELWRDEAFTAVVAKRPLQELLGTVSLDSAPPLSYLLDHVVVTFSTAPWALRLVPALAGTALIPITALLARRIRGESAACWAASFVAFLPSTVVSSRDARMYALGGACSLVAILLLWRCVERPARRTWIAYVVAVAAAAWTEYFDVFAIAAGLLAVITVLRPGRRATIIAFGSTAVAFATLGPWLVFAHAQFQHAETPFWVEPLGIAPVAGSLVQFFVGPPVDAEVPFRLGLQILQGASVLAGMLAFGWLLRRASVLGPGGRRSAAFSLVAGLGGVVALLMVSVVRPLFEARYASVMWLPLFALAGVGLSLAPRRASLAILGVIAASSLALSTVPQHPQTSELIPLIRERLGPSDLIEASPRQFLLLLDEGDATMRAQLHVIGPVPWYWGTAAYPAGAIVPAVPESVIRTRGRVLAVTEPEDDLPVVPPGYRKADAVCRIRVCLTVFEPPSAR